MSGTIKDHIDNSVTHIFVKDDEMDSNIKNLHSYEQTSIKIVKCKWIEDCFYNGQMYEIGKYLIDLNHR